MPLSPPVEREMLHQRAITLRGYQRTDGLFDIEAQLADTKSYDFSNDDRGLIATGENLHGMKLRMTIDVDLLIVACEAVTEQGPYAVCPDGAAVFSKLAGLTIKAGFLKAANERVGGAVGCTHLRELLQQVATVAFQTLYPVRAKRDAEAEKRRRAAGETSPATSRDTTSRDTTSRDARPRLLDSCFAYRRASPVVARRWPDLYTGPALSAPVPDESAADAPNSAETALVGSGAGS